MRKPTILLVIEGTYPWYRGGVSEWVHQYISALPEFRFRILQVATDQYLNASLSEALYPVPESVEEFVRIPPPNLSRDWERESIRWKEQHREAYKPLQRRADLVHVANTGFAGWLAKEIAAEWQKPLVLTEHALYWKEVAMGAVALECGYKIPEEETRKQDFVKMFQTMAGQVYSSAEIIISVSRCNIPEQEQMGAEAVQYIPNGVPRSWFRKTDSSYENPLTIGWIGRCAEMKNPLKFFSVIEAFEKRETEVCFVMMTCDANEPELERQVREKSAAVSNLEVIWNESTEDHIDRMDALCITSYNESQPLVLFEALGRKVLPIGWRAGDVTPEFGLILDQDKSTNQLVDSVLELWENKENWSREVQRRFRLVKDHHSWEKIFDRYHTLFTNLISPEEEIVG